MDLRNFQNITRMQVFEMIWLIWLAGEMIVGPTKVLFMDEISTGLDSSTTFQIVKCLQQIVHLGEATILMSLLQPAPETFELFDDIILLSEGQIVYQGPRDFVLEFFESCGFRCPERKGTADFLQEVTSSTSLVISYRLPECSMLIIIFEGMKAPCYDINEILVFNFLRWHQRRIRSSTGLISRGHTDIFQSQNLRRRLNGFMLDYNSRTISQCHLTRAAAIRLPWSSPSTRCQLESSSRHHLTRSGSS